MSRRFDDRKSENKLMFEEAKRGIKKMGYKRADKHPPKVARESASNVLELEGEKKWVRCEGGWRSPPRRLSPT